MNRTAHSAPGTLPQNRIGAIDGLRALACLMVYTYHVWQFGDYPALQVGPISSGKIIGNFSAGVDLFMVLSGYCLFWPLVSKPGSLDRWSMRDYAVRRIRRIVPPYYAAILWCTVLPIILLLFMRALGQSAKWQKLPDWWQYLTHLTFTHTLFPATWGGIQGAFWSLGLEMQFYIVFPLVILGFRRFGIAVTAAMIGVSLLYRILTADFAASLGSPGEFLVSVTFLGRWMQFAAGMIAAWFVAKQLHRNRQLPAGTGWMLLAAALGGYALATSGILGLWPRDLVMGIAFASAAVALCATMCPARRLFELRPVTWFGFISYSVFLVHQNMANFLGELLRRFLHLGGPARFAVLMTVGLACITVFAYLFHLCFEKPFLSTRIKHVSDPKVKAKVPAEAAA